MTGEREITRVTMMILFTPTGSNFARILFEELLGFVIVLFNGLGHVGVALFAPVTFFGISF